MYLSTYSTTYSNIPHRSLFGVLPYRALLFSSAHFALNIRPHASDHRLQVYFFLTCQKWRVTYEHANPPDRCRALRPESFGLTWQCAVPW